MVLDLLLVTSDGPKLGLANSSMGYNLKGFTKRRKTNMPKKSVISIPKSITLKSLTSSAGLPPQKTGCCQRRR